MAGHRTFRELTYSQPSGIYTKESNPASSRNYYMVQRVTARLRRWYIKEHQALVDLLHGSDKEKQKYAKKEPMPILLCPPQMQYGLACN